MWAGQGGWGSSWPIQQSAFADIPSEEVDWASLAKQWIAQREVMGMTSVPPPVEPPMQQQQYMPTPVSHHVAAPPPPPPPPPPVTDEQSHAIVNEPAVGGSTVCPQQPQNMAVVDADNCSSQDTNYEENCISQGGWDNSQGGWDNWNNSGWNSMSNWAAPPPPPPSDTNDSSIVDGQFPSTDAFMQPFGGFGQDPNEFYQQPYEIQGPGCGFPYWPEQPVQQQPPASMVTPLMMVGVGRPPFEYRPPPRRPFNVARSLHGAAAASMLEDSGLDAAKRRHLPVWIREGLEKMEREKQKQIDREKQLQDAAVAKKAQEAADAEALKAVNAERAQQGLAPIIKSRFDSDNEANSDSDADEAVEDKKPKTEPRVTKFSAAQPTAIAAVQSTAADEPFVSEEEKQARIMVRVRQMLTEVLLDVTNREIASIANSVYKSTKAKQAKAPAKQLAKSSALASITSLGLGYGSDSDDEVKTGNEASSAAESNSSSDDEQVEERIRRKKIDFERRMRELDEREREEEQKRREALWLKEEAAKHETVERLNENHTADPQPKIDDSHIEKKLSKLRAEHSRNDSAAGNSAVKKHKHSADANQTNGAKAGGDEQKLKKRGDSGLKSDKSGSSRKHQHSSSSSKRKHRREEAESESDSSSSTDESSSDSGEDDGESRSADEVAVEKTSSRHRHKSDKERAQVKMSRHKSEVDAGRSRSSREQSAASLEGEERRSKHKAYLEIKQSRHKDKVRRDDEAFAEESSHRRHSKDSKNLKRTDRESEDGHRRKRTSDADFRDRVQSELDSRSGNSSHKKLRRSRSRSRSADSHHKSAHRRRSSPVDKQESKKHRRSTPAAYRTEPEKDRSGKKSNTRRKSRSRSRSSDED